MHRIPGFDELNVFVPSCAGVVARLQLARASEEKGHADEPSGAAEASRVVALAVARYLLGLLQVDGEDWSAGQRLLEARRGACRRAPRWPWQRAPQPRRRAAR